MLNISCKNIFAPKLGELQGGNSIYRLNQEHPADVLHNFRYAYIYKDSLMYATCLDSEFVFIYYQADDESGGGYYDSWLLDTELKTTGRLLRTFNYIDLIWLTTLDSSFYLLQGDSIAESSEEYFETCNYAEFINSYQLSLGDYITLIGNAEFDFRKNDDGKWHIIRWEDKYK